MSIYITHARQYLIDAVYTLRVKNNVSQGNLAKILGVSYSFVCKAESSKYRTSYDLNHFDLLCSFFEVSPLSLISDEHKSPIKVRKRKPKQIEKIWK